MTAIINATLVMRDHFIPDGVLFIEDGKIKSYGEMRKCPVPEGCEVECVIALGYSDFEPKPLPEWDSEATILWHTKE